MRSTVALSILLVACSGSPTSSDDPVARSTMKGTVAPRQTMDLTRETVGRQATFTVARVRVWNALVEVHDVLEIPHLSGDSPSGAATFQANNRIRTIGGKPASRYVDCGNGPAGARADSYRLSIKLDYKFENPDANTTTLIVAMQAWARNPALSSDPVPCNSTGMLEREILGMVTTRLQ